MGQNVGMSTGELSQSEIDDLTHRAHRRWIITMVVVVAVAGVSGALGGLLGDHHHHQQPRHHSSTGGAIAAIVIGLVWLGFLGWLFLHARKHKHGLFAPQLLYGLKYRERRIVMRDVRAGTPNSDARLRHVETSVAERTVRYQRFSMIVFALAFVGELINASIRHNAAVRVLYVVLALMFVGLFCYQRVIVAGAKRYLAAGT